MIALCDRAGSPNGQALAALRAIYDKRVAEAGASDVAVFETDSLLEQTLGSTGGHVRSLCIAMREMLDDGDALPIGSNVVRRVSARLARDMRRGLEPGDRQVLAQVAGTGQECDDPAFFRLLRNGYLLAYQDDDSDWYLPHPWLGAVGQP